MARKRVVVALVLAAVATAASGVAVAHVVGSGSHQLLLFVLACACLIAAAVVTRWGSKGEAFSLRTADDKGWPLHLGDVDLGGLGVHRSGLGTGGYGPYVPREADRDLDDAISGGQTLVAVAGAVLAGRTRTLAEGALRHLAGSWLVWFEDVPGVRLADLVTEARRLGRGGPVVLWLENADLPLLSQFSARLLDDLPSGFRIFLTLDVALLDGGVLPGDAAEMLNAPGTCVRLGLITDEERERLAAQPIYAEVAAAHEDEPVLMGRLMVSLDRVTEALEMPDEDAICRVAVLHAAVDWQRAAVPESLTPKVIEKLYRDGYWHEQSGRRPEAVVSHGRFRHALRQLLATASGSAPQLLDKISGRENHLRPHPLLRVIADSTARPPGWEISETLWNYLAKSLNYSQLLTVGLNACSRGDYQQGRCVLEPLDVANIPARIVFRIAVDADESEEIAAARLWYGKAIASSDADITSQAMINLGRLELRQGNMAGARSWFGQAVATGQGDQALRGLNGLGNVEQQLGNFEEARSWYAKALATRNPIAAPMATLNLGTLEQNQGNFNAARDWYTEAIASLHADASAQAMANLGVLEQQQGNLKAARHWYAKALASLHADAAAHAMANLPILEQREGNFEAARDWFAKAIASGNHDAASRSMANLGTLEREQGNFKAARGWFAKALASRNPDAEALAMVGVGVLERDQGNFKAARGWFVKAIASRHAEAAPRAMANLGALEQEEGNFEAARDWFAKAIASGHGDAAAQAMLCLGILEQERGKLEEASSWYARTVASGYAQWAQRAKKRLDELQRNRVDLQRAENFAKYGAPFIDADFDHLAVAETLDTREDEPT